MVNSSRPFENWTRNRMVKDYTKTGHKLFRENDHLKTRPFGIWMVTGLYFKYFYSSSNIKIYLDFG
jgi:hypothetical protein